VPSQQPQGQLQTQHSVDTSNYDMDNHNIKSKTSYRQAHEEKHINAEKLTNERSNNNNNNNNNNNKASIPSRRAIPWRVSLQYYSYNI
jgi:hypothetical protein